ncbi:hypothetical protein H8356DRAFT_1421122 [Neocallimastix lanati (nom. inval.)]|nr:hypothetical protein H8356DRAFT_1421122 [Neocallimastix sp. JGI-2020a]
MPLKDISLEQINNVDGKICPQKYNINEQDNEMMDSHRKRGQFIKGLNDTPSEDYSFPLLWDGKDATCRSYRVFLYEVSWFMGSCERRCRRRRTVMTVKHTPILTYGKRQKLRERPYNINEQDNEMMDSHRKRGQFIKGLNDTPSEDYNFPLLWDGKDATCRSYRVFLYEVSWFMGSCERRCRRRRTVMTVKHTPILTYGKRQNKKEKKKVRKKVRKKESKKERKKERKKKRNRRNHILIDKGYQFALETIQKIREIYINLMYYLIFINLDFKNSKTKVSNC